MALQRCRLPLSTQSGSKTTSIEKVGKASFLRASLDQDKSKHSCKGKNDCKGQGGCKSSDNGCKGKNDCKGKGGCATDGSKMPSALALVPARADSRFVLPCHSSHLDDPPVTCGLAPRSGSPFQN